ncbi:hypothetical protein C8Q76DRAFT_797423 [Earliella scabrosa]|nr:hypothetical protein C8Q76DRAFT_797423 [Earliella scabrosa]
MDNWVMNLDILHAIMAQCTIAEDRRTLSNMMQTCRTLNYQGARYLLKDGVELCSVEQFLSFLSFACARGNLSEAINRMQWLESIIIDLQFAPTAEIAESFRLFFGTIISTSPRFVRLEIHAAEELLSKDPQLPNAIAAFTTLRSLMLDQAGEHGLRMLSAMRSSLTDVYLITTMETDSLSPGDRDPRLLLRHSASTLRSLSIIPNAPLPTSLEGPIYPALRNLYLEGVNLPVTAHFVSAFPHLSHFELGECLEEDVDEDQMEQHRNTNALLQVRHGTWPSLRSCRGSLFELYILGLKCHVSDVEIDQACEDAQVLIRVLEDTRPAHLTLHINYAHFFLEGDFAAIADSLAARDWKTLSLQFALRLPIDGQVDLREILESYIFNTVRNLPILAFEFVLDCSIWTDDMTDPEQDAAGGEQTVKPKVSFPVEEFYRKWDAKAFADRILDGAKSLKTVAIQILPRETSGDEVITVERGPKAIFHLADSEER